MRHVVQERPSSGRSFGAFLAACGVIILLIAGGSEVFAEWYVAGQLGANIPSKLSEVKGVGSLVGGTYSSQNLQTSLLYGAKLGYYLESLKWLGVETEVYNSTPNLQQGNVNSGSGGPLYPTSGGSTLRVTTWANYLVARYPGKTFQPYAGVGVGVNFATLASPIASSAANAVPGLNAMAGLRVFMTKNVALFGEYKYSYADFQFSDVTRGGGISARYVSNIVVGGLSYHF